MARGGSVISLALVAAFGLASLSRFWSAAFVGQVVHQGRPRDEGRIVRCAGDKRTGLKAWLRLVACVFCFFLGGDDSSSQYSDSVSFYNAVMLG